jgi:GT2 family glycosyltransferase
MKIACILLHYRNLTDTLACLNSLRDSGISGWKVFLINNHAADGSSRTLEDALLALGCEYVLLQPDHNLGFAGGCNLGARTAMNEGFSHVLLLNNDTRVAPDFSRKVEASVLAHPNDVLAGEVTDATGRPTHNIGKISPWTGRVRHILEPGFRGAIDFVSGCMMVVPMSVIARIGLFDERLFMYGEDADFCMRIARMGVKVRYVPAIRVMHEFSPSISRTGVPKEYYIQRNQAYVILRGGTARQRMLFSLWLAVMPAYKLVFRTRFFMQAVRGGCDGVLGRLGARQPK